MQDNQSYRTDLKNMIGRVLNHQDNFNQEQLDMFWEKTKKYKNELLPPTMFNKKNINGVYGGYQVIQYGAGTCGSAEKRGKAVKVKNMELKGEMSMETKGDLKGQTDVIVSIDGGGASCGKGMGIQMVEKPEKVIEKIPSPVKTVSAKPKPALPKYKPPKTNKNSGGGYFGITNVPAGGCGASDCGCGGGLGGGGCAAGGCGGGGCGGGGCGGC